MRRVPTLIVAVALMLGVTAEATGPSNVAAKLRDWQKGVWVSGTGTYTVWTDTHYFVIQASPQGDSLNIYCGSSQVAYTDKGIARKQMIRVRKMPGQALFAGLTDAYDETGSEMPLVIDEINFKPGQCVQLEGVIYDSVDEIGDDYILMSTCNGDKIKLHNNGTSAFLPADGGEFWSVRIETF
ncbi:MAG TPA: hypothetical protein VM118_00555 [Acidobacteriota bacterium]|nr:hypothetical protein [Acidobacteriota bacterium]